MALERQDERHAHHGAGGDVGGLEREAVPVLDLTPRLGQPIHGYGEILAVEPPRYLRISEKHQAEQWEDLLQRRGELPVEARHRFELTLGSQRLIPVDDRGRGLSVTGA